MNSNQDNKNTRSETKQNIKSEKNLSKVKNFSGQQIEQNNKNESNKVNENEREIDFEPISYKKQAKRNNSKNGESDSGERNNDRNSRLRRFSLKKDKAVRYESKKETKNVKNKDRKTSKAGTAMKNATKASLKTSGNVTAKGLMAAWGLGSTLVKQDILFRLLLGLFVGAAFVSMVILGR